MLRCTCHGNNDRVQREQPHCAFLSELPTVPSQFAQMLWCYVTSAAFVGFHNVFVAVWDILPSISLGTEIQTP